eukprot:357037_1
MSPHPVYCGPDEFSHPINVVNLILCLTWLIVSFVTGYTGFKNLYNQQCKKRILNKYKYVFIISFICGVTSTISYILIVMFCYIDFQFAAYILLWPLALPYHVLLASIWFNLLLRLEAAFKSSTFASSIKMMIFFKIIGVSMFILGITQLVIWLTAYHTIYFGNFANGNSLTPYEIWLFENPLSAFYITGVEMFIFVVFANIFSYMFVYKLLQLTKLQVGSTRDVTKVILNRKQTKFVDVASRTILLSAIACITTILILTIVWWRAFNQGAESIAFPMTTFLQLIDMAINFVCIYLQYNFSAKHYRKFCRCGDKLFKRFIEKQVGVYVQQKYHIAFSIPTDISTHTTTSEMGTRMRSIPSATHDQHELKASEKDNEIEIFTTRGKTLTVDKSLFEDAVNIGIPELLSILAKQFKKKTDDITLVQFNNQFILDETPGIQDVTKVDMVNLVYGACFLASGGGGPLDMGLEFAAEIKQDSIKLVKPQVVEKGNSSIIAADLGSPQAILTNKKLGRTAPLNCTKYMKTFIQEKYNSTLTSIYPVEIGAANTIIPFFVASNLKLNVMDCDIAGRSVPYIWDTLLAVNDIPCCPACIAKDDDSDDKEEGDPILYDNTQWTPFELNTAIVEQMGKNKWNVDACGLNLWLILEPWKKEFYDIINTFTIDISIKLGRVFTDKDIKGPEKLVEISKILATQEKRMYKLFRGKLIFFGTKPQEAIDLNRVVFLSDDDQQMAIYGLNENLIAFDLKKQQLRAMGPDGIAFLDDKYQPLDITSIEQYKQKDITFTIIGVEAWDNLLKQNFVNAMTKTVESCSLLIRKNYPQDNLPIINKYIPISELQKQ